MKDWKEFYYEHLLIKHIREGIETIRTDPATYKDDDGNTNYFLSELVDGSEGRYQANYIVETFDLKDQAKQYLELVSVDGNVYKPEIWEKLIQPELNELAEEMIENLEDFLDGYTLYFGGCEDDGSYGLFLFKNDKTRTTVLR